MNELTGEFTNKSETYLYISKDMPTNTVASLYVFLALVDDVIP